MDLPRGIKGAPDWLPPDARAFEHVERTVLDTAARAGYERVRTPIFEPTEVFARGVGESTDVVQKEMYTFLDKGDRSLTLRPEGTAGVMRAALEANVPKTGGLPAKWAYAGEFFRQERPQAGRQRQFNQVGIEALGTEDPVVDAETVLLGWEALQRLGLHELVLRINNLGDREDRAAYHEHLNAYLDRFDLPAEVEERRRLNPLRAFDSKAPGMAEIMAEAPVLSDHVSEAAKAHYAQVVELLEAEGVPLTHDPQLVRGLDYYTRTTFEYQAANLGAQSAVGGGGRYDGLAEDLGWPERFPGIGWALGIDRTLLALRTDGVELPETQRVAVFVVAASTDLAPQAFALTSELRRAGTSADLACDGRSLKAQFKAADRSGARYAVVLGQREVEAGEVTVRDLFTGEQRTVARDAAVAEFLEG
ncbi:histidine--tRNA ligase [Egibacter rhizosphaerae]|uniref:Histidine--tRNA ligase n=1 Tax=Egibacter rhizosphaerae TaxID=1670831 RepID=A0A411YJV2_9ACTN|nr:histidine--tRNA ligase [Egibacter rhizosphaerae]QBI21476.1 histidine--tRNA ligase [Egibacter rhizosphaerae]